MLDQHLGGRWTRSIAPVAHRPVIGHIRSGVACRAGPVVPVGRGGQVARGGENYYLKAIEVE
ncbi:hypothetical protein AB0E96_00610, partial [Kitasatospora sp. NPDC036755]|uniref:hypothetical protein n=1 Tax=Kitasatospora sp. NPDC036755 TaxID=3154600 RepID=UPI0033CC6FEE